MAVALHLAAGVVLVALWLRPLARLDSRRGRHQRQRLTRWWMRRLLAILRVRLEMTGVPAPEPVLVVANHISWLDIPCLLACLDARFVAKSEVGRWPVIGFLAGGAGTLFLDRGAGAAALAERMRSSLAAGERLVLFPEGTSTDGRTVRPFHARLYQAAIGAGAPVQTVAIRYPRHGGLHPLVPFIEDDDFMSHLWRLLGENGIVAQLHFGPLLASSGASRRALADRSRRELAAALGVALLPPAGAGTIRPLS